MWNRKKSIYVSIAVCWFILAALILIAILAPFFLKDFYMLFGGRIPSAHLDYVILGCYYPCAAFGILADVTLLKMLSRIEKDNPFCKENVKGLKIISICCFVVGIITFVGSFSYRPFFFVTSAALFVGLILRVVKNVMQTAVEMREENDLTI